MIRALKRFSFAAALALAACGGGGGGTPPVSSPAPQPSAPGESFANVTRISTDPFTNSGSQHATEVEPSAAANGNTIVAAFQTGRFFQHGASDIGWATSLDGGAAWQHGALPGTTLYALPAAPYDSISDPAVAYDARHNVWLVSSLPVSFSNAPVPGVVVSRSSDGMTWGTPVDVTPANETTNDKNWIACDNHSASPYYGRCYIEWDSYAGSGTVLMSESADGGQTWSAPVSPSSTTGGIGGQPVVQPNGTVIVPIDDIYAQNVLSFTSANGGASWSATTLASNIADHQDAGNIRSLPLISAAVDAGGTVYVVWQDCRFRASCAENDLVMITSTNGTSWTPPARIPIDATTSAVDHFIPGLGAEPGTSGTAAHLGLTYYSYANTSCTASTCQLSANFISSQDGGATWGSPQLLAGPMSLTWIAQTMDGAMVGDYMATVFASGHAIGFVTAATPNSGSAYNHAAYASKPGAVTVQSVVRHSSAGDHPVPGYHSDHPPHRIHP